METIGRLFREPKGSYFLLGPRGTGKSTLLRDRHPDAVVIDLLDPARMRRFTAHPEHLAEVVAAQAPGTRFVIDEVQRVPEILPVVHALMERGKGWTFVLTGSSARKLRRAGNDLLAGRAALRTMHPFLAAELGERFDLGRALSLGLLPVVLGAESPRDALDAYVALYLREEVQAEGLVRNVGNFSRFLEAASFSHASVLTVSNVARECGVERKVVEGYVGILEDLLLAFRLPAFARRARRELVAHPKLYLFDAGVFRALRPRGPLDRPEEAEGQALEGLVAQHLRAWAASATAPPELSYWRTRSGVEVDFVVYGEEGIFGIEVKRGGVIHPRDLRGLKAFREEYPGSRGALLHRGAETFVRDGIRCVPVAAFLAHLRPGHGLAEALDAS